MAFLNRAPRALRRGAPELSGDTRLQRLSEPLGYRSATHAPLVQQLKIGQVRRGRVVTSILETKQFGYPRIPDREQVRHKEMQELARPNDRIVQTAKDHTLVLSYSSLNDWKRSKKWKRSHFNHEF